MTHNAKGAGSATRTESLVAFLRSETKSSHEALERTLHLLQPPLEKRRFTHVLGRFLGFHIIWEKAIAAHPKLTAFARDRSRLRHLCQDLVALGLSERDIARLPQCDAAAALAGTETSAMGSIYVIEGSTLGGRLISRGLADTPWLPEAGLTYFNPYGDHTGAMWQSFKAWCDEEAGSLDWNEAAAGARATFALLQGWLDH